MSTTETEANTSGYAASTESLGGLGQRMSDRFRPLSAMRIFQAKLTKQAQHVAMMLALMTRAERGRVEVKLSELTKATGWSVDALMAAITKIEQAGLLTKERRGSVANVYRWTEAAYVDAHVGVKPEKW